MSIRRDNILKVYHHEKPWFIPQYFDIDACIPTAFTDTIPVYGIGQDDWGVTWKYLETQPGPIQDESIPHVLDDVTDWKNQVKIPDIESFDWAGASARDTASWDRENRISNVIIVNGMWERFHSLRGFQDALMDLLMEPEDCYDLISAIADYRVSMVHKIAEYYKPDKIQMHDDYGMEKNLFFSKDVWMEIMRPNLKKVVDAVHEHGILYEHHSCGYIAPLLDEFVELGIDAWNPVQFANKPYELMKQYAGKMTFVGGFEDRLFVNPNATDEDKKNSIRETIRIGGEYGLWVPHTTTVAEEYRDFMYNAVYEHNKPIFEEMGLTGPRFESAKFGEFTYAYAAKK